jgi:predicted GNAT family acetyltransferase
MVSNILLAVCAASNFRSRYRRNGGRGWYKIRNRCRIASVVKRTRICCSVNPIIHETILFTHRNSCLSLGMAYENLPLTVNTVTNHFELELDGHTAFIEFRLSAHRLFLIHTEVPAALEGKGVGSAIVQKTLQYAKDNDHTIVPLCPFVRSYLDRHQEWNELLDPESDRFIN